ncbi:MAG: hypothetical protein OXH52_16905 [Gammaproteobacteria bacterium]|nr:hypothetical protein [Gammaproteobacteria bacterium]
MESPPTTFTEQDLQDAVRDGVISETEANAFRFYMASRSPQVDEEAFHLFRGFNDVFVALASVLLLTGITWFAGGLGAVAAALIVMAVAVGLSEYFTLSRRLALSSIVYAVAFSIAAAMAVFRAFWPDDLIVVNDGVIGVLQTVTKFGISSALACGAAAAGLFWWRYRVPIAVAVGMFFLGAMLYWTWVLFSPFENPFLGANVVLFVLGLGAFCFAMHWDMRDPDRISLNSDVAFWLHLLAAPAIAHPIFWWVQSGGLPADWLEATAVVGCYLGLACVAVVVNRRAIMVAATAYLIGAVAWYFEELSALYSVAISLVLIGCLFLSLAVWWSTVRAALVRCLPGTVRNVVAPA